MPENHAALQHILAKNRQTKDYFEFLWLINIMKNYKKP